VKQKQKIKDDKRKKGRPNLKKNVPCVKIARWKLQEATRQYATMRWCMVCVQLARLK
jgi:hypothetical protein